MASTSEWEKQYPDAKILATAKKIAAAADARKGGGGKGGKGK